MRGGLVFGVFIGLFVGLTFGLGLGGAAALQHLALRWMLRRGRLVPPRLVSFLDYVVEHVLLQTDGGGYRFESFELRDYFAGLSTDHEAPASGG